MAGDYLALFTGSRDWDDEKPILKVIMVLPTGCLVIVGDCPTGADEIVRRLLLEGSDGRSTTLAIGRGIDVEVHHADWDVHGRVAGRYRNLAMLDRRPDIVYAFLKNNSSGTRHLIREARRRSIEISLTRADAPGS